MSSDGAVRYCIKCKDKTGDVEGSEIQTTGKQGHPFVQTRCVVCDSKKNRYLKHDPANPPIITRRAPLSKDDAPETPKTPKIKKSRSTKKEKAQPAANVAGVAATPVDAE